ncbi:MAG: hypothetical protein QG671_3661, partial [Actinomycetota bacterium]|nr:hypothetical protein [Actinomycetota bacterium]
DVSVNPKAVLPPAAIAPFHETFFAVNDPPLTAASALHAEMVPFHGMDTLHELVAAGP